MRYCLTLALIVLSALAFGKRDSTFVRAPKWNVRTQFAGLQGLGSVGGSWTIPDGRFQAGLMYGYAPSLSRSAPDFHGITGRVTGSWFPVHEPLYKGWHLSPITSISLMVEAGGIAYLTTPDDLPDDYYEAPHALHGILSVGGRCGRINSEGGWALTVETVALDTHLWYAISQEHVQFTEVWSLAIGAEYYF